VPPSQTLQPPPLAQPQLSLAQPPLAQPQLQSQPQQLSAIEAERLRMVEAEKQRLQEEKIRLEQLRTQTEMLRLQQQQLEEQKRLEEQLKAKVSVSCFQKSKITFSESNPNLINGIAFSLLIL
jgi:hypothetical protein